MTTAVWADTLFPPNERVSKTMTRRAQTIDASRDASRLTLPIQIAGAILIAAVGVTSGYWAAQSNRDLQTQQALKDIQSDMRIITQQMKSDGDLRRMESEYAKSQSAATKDEMTEIKRQVQLLQVQYQQIQLALAKGK